MAERNICKLDDTLRAASRRMDESARFIAKYGWNAGTRERFFETAIRWAAALLNYRSALADARTDIGGAAKTAHVKAADDRADAIRKVVNDWYKSRKGL